MSRFAYLDASPIHSQPEPTDTGDDELGGPTNRHEEVDLTEQTEPAEQMHDQTDQSDHLQAPSHRAEQHTTAQTPSALTKPPSSEAGADTSTTADLPDGPERFSAQPPDRPGTYVTVLIDDNGVPDWNDAHFEDGGPYASEASVEAEPERSETVASEQAGSETIPSSSDASAPTYETPAAVEEAVLSGTRTPAEVRRAVRDEPAEPTEEATTELVRQEGDLRLERGTPTDDADRPGELTWTDESDKVARRERLKGTRHQVTPRALEDGGQLLDKMQDAIKGSPPGGATRGEAVTLVTSEHQRPVPHHGSDAQISDPYTAIAISGLIVYDAVVTRLRKDRT